MVGWLIVLGILLIIVIALFMSVSVSIEYDDALRVKIKYAGIKVFSLSPEDTEKKKHKKKKPKKEKKEKDKKKKKSDIAEENPQNTANEASADSEGDKSEEENKTAEKGDGKKKKKAKKPKKNLSETFELIKMLVDSASKPVKRLISHIRITNVLIDITASGDDAHKAALNYGKINWALSSVLSFLDRVVRLSVKKVNVGVDFCSGKTDFYISCKIKMRVSTAIGCALWFLIRMLKINLSKSKQVNKPQNANTQAQSSSAS